MKPELLLKINGFVTKYEYPMLGILIATLLLHEFTDFEFTSTVLILVYSTLALLYFLSAFGDVHNMQSVEKTELDSKWHFLVPFSKKLIAIASAISCMAIIFTSLHWPGGINQLIPGISTLIVCIITFQFLRNKNAELVLQSLLVRALVLAITLACIWYFTPLPLL